MWVPEWMSMNLNTMIPHKKWCTLKKEPIKTTGSGDFAWSLYYIWEVMKEWEIQGLEDVEWDQQKKNLKMQIGSSHLSKNVYTGSSNQAIKCTCAQKETGIWFEEKCL